MGNDLNKFEQALKEAAESVSFPYEADSWNKLEKRLDEVQPSVASSSGKWYAMGIAAAVAILAIALWPSQEKAEIQPESQISEEVQKLKQQLTEEAPVVKEQKPFISDLTETQELLEGAQKDVAEEEAIEETIHAKEGTLVQEAEGKPDMNSSAIHDTKVKLEQEQTTKVEGAKPTQSFAFNLNQSLFCESVELFGVPENVNIEANGLQLEKRSSTSYQLQPKQGVHTLIASDENGNVLDEVKVTFGKQPNAVFNTNASLDRLEPKTEFVLEELTEGADYRWNFGDGNYSFDQKPEHLFKRKGSYEVALMVVSPDGCSSTHKELVYVEHDYNLLAPNSFSPNNDGLNDSWFPKALEIGQHEFTLEVVDIKGNLVFRSNRSDLHWDGQVPGMGMANPRDVFQWKALVKDEEGEIEIYNGTITVYGK